MSACVWACVFVCPVKAATPFDPQGWNLAQRHIPTCRWRSQTFNPVPKGVLLWKFHKTKIEGHPWKWGDRSGQTRFQTSPGCLAAGPSANRASAAMVPWPFRLKFGREMGTHPGRSMPMGTPTPGSGGPKTRFQGTFTGPCSGLGLYRRFVICSGCWKCTGRSRALLLVIS